MSRLRALAGVDETAVDLPEAATVADLLHLLREQYPGIEPLIPHAVVMVNHTIVAPQATLRDGDQVMLLQILGGG
jgi:sulfur carrier protein ThiS